MCAGGEPSPVNWASKASLIRGLAHHGQPFGRFPVEVTIADGITVLKSIRRGADECPQVVEASRASTTHPREGAKPKLDPPNPLERRCSCAWLADGGSFGPMDIKRRPARRPRCATSGTRRTGD